MVTGSTKPICPSLCPCMEPIVCLSASLSFCSAYLHVLSFCRFVSRSICVCVPVFLFLSIWFCLCLCERLSVCVSSVCLAALYLSASAFSLMCLRFSVCLFICISMCSVCLAVLFVPVCYAFVPLPPNVERFVHICLARSLLSLSLCVSLCLCMFVSGFFLSFVPPSHFISSLSGCLFLCVSVLSALCLPVCLSLSLSPWLADFHYLYFPVSLSVRFFVVLSFCLFLSLLTFCVLWVVLLFLLGVLLFLCLCVSVVSGRLQSF